VATAQPAVAVPRAPQAWLPQLNPFTPADGDVDWFGASYRVACLPPGTAPGDIKEDFLVLRALKRERCWPFAGSQDRVPLVVCLVFHRWPGHGDVREDSLVVRTLKRDCRRLFCVEFSGENHAVCLLLQSAQERLTLLVFWVVLSSERCVCGFCQALDENRDEKVLSDILRRGNAPKRAGAYVSARKEIKPHNVNNVQYPRIPIYTNPYQNPIYHVFQRDVVLDRGVGRPRMYWNQPCVLQAWKT
jgi:hypothetical protein